MVFAAGGVIRKTKTKTSDDDDFGFDDDLSDEERNEYDKKTKNAKGIRGNYCSSVILC